MCLSERRKPPFRVLSGLGRRVWLRAQAAGKPRAELYKDVPNWYCRHWLKPDPEPSPARSARSRPRAPRPSRAWGQGALPRAVCCGACDDSGRRNSASEAEPAHPRSALAVRQVYVGRARVCECVCGSVRNACAD